jgi:hypothetical protein
MKVIEGCEVDRFQSKVGDELWLADKIPATYVRYV